MPFRCIRCNASIDKTFKACPHCGEAVTDFLRRYLEEPIDGKYEIVQRLGAGGMGEVYKVQHTYLGATRVVKVIRPQIAENREAHARFLREARLGTKVQHPNVATLHDFSALPDGSHYMVWEYIDGENLAQRLKTRGTLPPRYAVSLVIQALQGLDAIHRAGIVHRDISPENLMITRDGHGDERVKIIDLGVAKTDEPVENATRTGMFVGKFRYASPEHLGFLEEGERIDGRADLYSLAIVLYEMLSGRPPFEATSPHDYIRLHARESQFRPLDIPPGLPGGAELEQILKRALARERSKRFANAAEFGRALEEVARTLPDPSLSRTLAATPTGDETMRQTDPDPMHLPTLRTPLPTGPTLRTPVPTSHSTIRSERRTGSWSAFAGFIAALFLIGGLAAVFAFRYARKAEPARAASESPSSPVNPATTAAPAASTIDVSVRTPEASTISTGETASDSSMEPPAAATPPPVATTTPTLAPTLRRTVRERIARQRPGVSNPSEERVPEIQRPAAVTETYLDGGTGDSDANDRMLASLQRQLSGVSQVAVQGSGDPALLRTLTAAISEHVTVTPGADVVIHFNGSVERLGRGKKRRAAEASIVKRGRVIFRYELPAEEYRVGDDPAEAFARILHSALGQ